MTLFAVGRKPNRPRRHKPEPDRKSLDTLKAIDLVAFNSVAESRFIVIVSDLLSHKKSLPLITVIQEVAYRLNISTETAKRYLLKFSASQAPFMIEQGQVRKRG